MSEGEAKTLKLEGAALIALDLLREAAGGRTARIKSLLGRARDEQNALNEWVESRLFALLAGQGQEVEGQELRDFSFEEGTVTIGPDPNWSPEPDPAEEPEAKGESPEEGEPCARCAELVPVGAKFCPHCGLEVGKKDA